ncbi:hypothetical protein KAR91_00800 [Candidatus Pacearchaeota archaeon]|nr:hypothetical protein [Candidatus Pacearchaeota archaeon]
MGVKKDWVFAGLRCRVLDSPVASYNGYVALTKDHPDHGKDYDDIRVNVHGGLTFSQHGSDDERDGEVLFPNESLYWVEFDTAHSGDWLSYSPQLGGRKWSVEDVAKETEYLAKQLSDLQSFGYNKERLGELTKERTRINKEIRRLRKVRGCE